MAYIPGRQGMSALVGTALAPVEAQELVAVGYRSGTYSLLLVSRIHYMCYQMQNPR